MTEPKRRANRASNAVRPIKVTLDFQNNPLSSVLIEYGQTKVICSVSFTAGVPKFLKGTNTGWLTAEYSMLPSATAERVQRESSKGKQNGRTLEIQRLIGRTLRNCVQLENLGENTFTVDCDVIHADGGTRTASITGASVALKLAIDRLIQKNKITNKKPVFLYHASAVSIGVVHNNLLIDLDYLEDSHAQSDMNFVMNAQGEFLEIQASAEESTLSVAHFQESLNLAQNACKEILACQEKALS